MKNFFIGNNPLQFLKKEPVGKFVELDGETYYQITDFDHMPPFFISVASDSNHWMYISSMGGLSCGRVNPDFALFPYYTDDKINEAEETTGSKTIFHVEKAGRTYLWEPFTHRNKGIYNTERSIAKNTIGNKIVFTETNHDLGLTFTYSWMNSDRFGWVKKSTIRNNTTEVITLFLVDGLQNVLPSGVDKDTQNGYSTLVDGYKKTELVENTGLALFRMESILVDKAEPSESLRANTVWQYGLNNPYYLLSCTQLDAVRTGEKPMAEPESKGVRGALFACADLALQPAESRHWYFVAEIAQDVVAINNLAAFIRAGNGVVAAIENNIADGTAALNAIVAQADGVQHTADQAGMARHYANVLFNVMRGGIYANNYTVNTTFLAQHIEHFNVRLFEKYRGFLKSLPPTIAHEALEALVQTQNDLNLYRVVQEYLPLTFSRRHGDPSRPWNHFSINIKDDAGNKVLSYQGNWRDIFQNWEALSLSYPGFLNAIIAKFLNATTADGYNAYRITNKGIEWEEIEPDNPWSNIGYWGDHQIIYLQKLLELSQKHYPVQLQSVLNKAMFSYANVPYRLKSYDEIVTNPKESIRFDHQLHTSILKLEQKIGADARLVLSADGSVLLVTFTEKILATLLSKLSNFIPEAGIWLNTQRPEWNDANNALVGSGVSMVTLYYMRRFTAFAKELYAEHENDDFVLTTEMKTFFDTVSEIFSASKHLLNSGFNDVQRRAVTDALGKSGELFRNRVYAGFSGRTEVVSGGEISGFLELTLAFIDQSIAVNRRNDKMFHAYNLISFNGDKIVIRHLYEMLEGQVAVLSSGKLNAEEVLQVLDALRASDLYRADQNSYILYPNKTLPLLVDKNNIPSDAVSRIALLAEMVSRGDRRVVTADGAGQFHFNAGFNSVNFLRVQLETIKTEGKYAISDADCMAIETLYEQVFDHQSFTGRSGTFYKYEGLGCIYWHMVSKLVLAIAENLQRFCDAGIDKTLTDKILAHYREAKAGLGAHKSPAVYGAFPFDPYSHTPTMMGAQQPGMTGLVKEDIISRFIELGVKVSKGRITFEPCFLNRSEFISEAGKTPQLSFTYCSIPIQYQLATKGGISAIYRTGDSIPIDGYTLSEDLSRAVFNRDNRIERIIVYVQD